MASTVYRQRYHRFNMRSGWWVSAAIGSEVTQMARRIAAILLLEPALDANYRAVAAVPSMWVKA